MTVGGPTREQELFALHDGEAFVEACPGAGKTRTIVERLSKIAETLPLRRGIAILSFTNSAVEEFTKRSREAGVDRLLRYPGFVGTFDAFVRHFLVLPFGISASTSRPVIVDSWKSLGVDIRLSGNKSFKGDGVCLDDFDPETNAIDPTRIGNKTLGDHVRQHQADYQQSAAKRRYFLHRAGYLSASDARVEARRHIQNASWNQALGRALAARFHEVIVDEAQDCNPLDLEIISWLRRHGLRVTVVCDPDQAIYEFRHGSPDCLRAFAEEYRLENRLRLTGNFRSTNPICALAATLRSRQDPDTPRGETTTTRHPVIVVAYPVKVPPEVGRLFIERIEAKAVGLTPANGIVLAHRHCDAQRAAGDPLARVLSGTSRTEALARAVGEFWSPSATGRSRDSAIRAVEQLLLELMGHWREGDHSPIRVIERVGLDRRQFRRQALQLLMSLPKTCDDTENHRYAWVASAQAEVESLRLALPQGKTVPLFFRRPTPRSQWWQHLQPPVVKSLASSTIHEAKGREYEAVCVVLRPNRAPENRTSQLFDAWESRTDLEAKRVIYVGVTRARRFVMLAVPNALAGRCVAILDRGKVPYEHIQIHDGPTKARR